MKISNLPPNLRELAEERSYQSGLEPDTVCNSFPWVETPEGIDFWKEVNEGVGIDQKEAQLEREKNENK